MNHAGTGPDIVQERCRQCGACVGACSHGSLQIADSRLAVVHPEDCDDCGACEEACPEGAISCTFQIVWKEPASESTAATVDGGRHD